jgi:hypothetical protein
VHNVTCVYTWYKKETEVSQLNCKIKHIQSKYEFEFNTTFDVNTREILYHINPLHQEAFFSPNKKFMYKTNILYF